VTTSLLDRPATRVRGVLVFLLIAFGIAWTGMIGAPLLGLSIVSPLVQLPFAFAPAIAAIVVRRWVTREGFAGAGLALRLRPCWRSYLIAWLGPLWLVATTLVLATALGWWAPDLTPLGDVVPGLPWWAFVAVLMVVVPLLTPIYWGEEFGWIDLRMRLFPERPLAATLATGLVWSVWHYPLAFVGYIDFDNVPLGLAIWTGWFLAQQVLLSWLRIRSGSIWPTSLAHAGNNMVLSLLVGDLLRPSGLDDTALTLLMAVATAVAAGWVVATGRLTRVTQSPR
jgi:membrane protease YdiL (CAAX protease family)